MKPEGAMERYFSYAQQSGHYFNRPHERPAPGPVGGAASWRRAEVADPAQWRAALTNAEIDEGGKRLLVTSRTAAGDQLLAVDLRPPPRLGEVTQLARISIDDGFFPTGVIYDRLGTAVVRAVASDGMNSTALKAFSVAPP